MSAQQKTQKGQEVPNLTEDEARKFFEEQCWPGGPVCPHCQSRDYIPQTGKGVRDGLYYCRACQGQYSVTIGTVMEDSHPPLSTWAKAFHYMASSKKGVSALFLMRALGLGSYRTAWFLAHRIRLAMRGAGDDGTPMGGTDKPVEIDETYVGGRRLGKGQAEGWKNKTPVVSLVEKGGRKRSRVVTDVCGDNVKEILKEETAGGAEVHSDTSPIYKSVHTVRSNYQVNHSKKEYVRWQEDGRVVTTNTVEGSFSLLKRGIMGQFHSVSRKHLHRYCDEFDARWNLRFVSDTERRDAIIQGAKGKRLTYREPILGGKLLTGA
jgi:hypothetical protein